MSDKKQGNWFKRHKILTVLGAIIVIAIIANVANGGSSDTNNATNNASSGTSKTNETKTDAMPKIGQAARDGKFEFIVNSVKCGETTVGTNEYLQDKATGQFCRVNMSIKNIGNEAQSLFADNQKLIDDQNRQYSYDSTATIYATPSDSGSTWYDQINPGNSVTGDILFDVPADATLTTAELHDSAFSGGVKVDIKQ